MPVRYGSVTANDQRRTEKLFVNSCHGTVGLLLYSYSILLDQTACSADVALAGEKQLLNLATHFAG